MIAESYHGSRLPSTRARATFDRHTMIQVIQGISLRSGEDFEAALKARNVRCYGS